MPNPTVVIVHGLTLIIASHAVLAAGQPTSVIVSGGDFDRRDTVVSFQLPQPATGRLALRSPEGGLLALQVNEKGRAVFVEQSLKKGATRRYQLVPAKPGSFAINEARQDRLVVRLSVGGKTALDYQTEPSEVPSPDIPELFRHGAHLHPVLTPAGRLVTGDYPPDHRWHRGIWLAWTHTEFEGRQPDFWNMGKEKSGFTGEVRFDKLLATWSGLVESGFRAAHRFIDHTGAKPAPVLNEEWTVTAYSMTPSGMRAHVFDLISVQTCAGSEPVKLPKYFYGGLGFRGHRQWEEKGNFSVLTSEGESDRVKANQNRCRWVDLSGQTDGQLCGLAILCHPDNFRAPQPVRVNPKNPQTCHAPSELGDWEIAPGKPYISRYRFVVHDGPPNAAELDRLWNDYAHPPAVKVE